MDFKLQISDIMNSVILGDCLDVMEKCQMGV